MVSSKYLCDVCRDTEWVSVVVNGEEFMQPCTCMTKRHAERLQKMCGLNDAERLVTLFSITPNGPDTVSMVNAAKSFIEHPSAILTIYGTCGNAKTLALQSIVNACLAGGVPAIYTTFYDLVQWVRESYSYEKSDSAWLRVKRLQDVRVLCIDELDKVKSTEWVREVETQLLDSRYRDGIAGKCGTVLAMNGTPAQLSDHLQSRIYDGRNVVVENSDPDMRKVSR